MGRDFKRLSEERRSVNFFDKNKTIDKSILKDIINDAVLTPSSFNTQPWRIILIESEEAKQKLFKEANKQEKIIESAVTLIIVGKKFGFRRHNPIWDEKIANGYMTEEAIQGYLKFAESILYSDDIKKTSYAVRNSSLLAMTIMYSAKYYGVDSHPMIGFDEEKTKKLFDIGED